MATLGVLSRQWIAESTGRTGGSHDLPPFRAVSCFLSVCRIKKHRPNISGRCPEGCGVASTSQHRAIQLQPGSAKIRTSRAKKASLLAFFRGAVSKTELKIRISRAECQIYLGIPEAGVSKTKSKIQKSPPRKFQTKIAVKRP